MPSEEFAKKSAEAAASPKDPVIVKTPVAVPVVVAPVVEEVLPGIPKETGESLVKLAVPAVAVPTGLDVANSLNAQVASIEVAKHNSTVLGRLTSGISGALSSVSGAIGGVLSTVTDFGAGLLSHLPIDAVSDSIKSVLTTLKAETAGLNLPAPLNASPLKLFDGGLSNFKTNIGQYKGDIAKLIWTLTVL